MDNSDLIEGDEHPYERIVLEEFGPRLRKVSPSDDKMLGVLCRSGVMACGKRGLSVRYEVRGVKANEVHVVVFIEGHNRCRVFELPELAPGVADQIAADEIEGEC